MLGNCIVQLSWGGLVQGLIEYGRTLGCCGVAFQQKRLYALDEPISVETPAEGASSYYAHSKFK